LKAASFVTIGEPRIRLHLGAPASSRQPESKSPAKKGRQGCRRSRACHLREFDKLRKGLDRLAVAKTRRAAEQTLKISIADKAFERLYGHVSHPFPARLGQKVAVRVVSQFGEETTKVMTVA
jgi:hypothetical protein